MDRKASHHAKIPEITALDFGRGKTPNPQALAYHCQQNQAYERQETHEDKTDDPLFSIFKAGLPSVKTALYCCGVRPFHQFDITAIGNLKPRRFLAIQPPGVSPASAANHFLNIFNFACISAKIISTNLSRQQDAIAVNNVRDALARPEAEYFF